MRQTIIGNPETPIHFNLEELFEVFSVTQNEVDTAGGDFYQALANKNNVSRERAKSDAFFWMYGQVKK